MAKREALRDLQSRLAGRLQSALTDGGGASWLAVRVGALHCLFPLAQSGEIFPLGPMAAVPYVQPWFLGVVNLRGGLYGAVDLAKFMQGDAAVVRTEPSWAAARLVSFNLELDLNCALVIDGLVGLRRQDAFASMEPAAQEAPAYFGNRFKDSEGVLWQEINLQVLSQLPEFLGICA
jgi:twitching motility protein PilI